MIRASQLRWLILFLLLLALRGVVGAQRSAEVPRNTVPTFHRMSLYWPGAKGAPANRCDVAYRKANNASWRAAHELWWDAKHRFYAGVVVSLEAGTDYEFKLALASGGQTVLRDRTWPERFPVARTVALPLGTRHETLRLCFPRLPCFA